MMVNNKLQCSYMLAARDGQNDRAYKNKSAYQITEFG